MNQGEISVHSDGEDKGSTFSFSMKMEIPGKKKTVTAQM